MLGYVSEPDVSTQFTIQATGEELTLAEDRIDISEHQFQLWPWQLSHMVGGRSAICPLARSPLGVLQDALGGGRHEGIVRCSQLSTRSIHGLGHFVLRMSRQIFPQGIAEQSAARLL